MAEMELLKELAQRLTRAHEAEDAAHMRAREWRQRRLQIEQAIAKTIGDEDETHEFLEMLKQQSGCLNDDDFFGDPQILKEQDPMYQRVERDLRAKQK